MEDTQEVEVELNHQEVTRVIRIGKKEKERDRIVRSIDKYNWIIEGLFEKIDEWGLRQVMNRKIRKGLKKRGVRVLFLINNPDLIVLK